MIVTNLKEIEPLLNKEPQAFMIMDTEIKRIVELTNGCGGSAVARAGIIKILSDVVHRTG